MTSLQHLYNIVLDVVHTKKKNYGNIQHLTTCCIFNEK